MTWAAKLYLETRLRSLLGYVVLENDLEGKLHSYKITVGKTVAGLFFSVQAEGDSWEEVIAKVQNKAKITAG